MRSAFLLVVLLPAAGCGLASQPNPVASPASLETDGDRVPTLLDTPAPDGPELAPPPRLIPAPPKASE